MFYFSSTARRTLLLLLLSRVTAAQQEEAHFQERWTAPARETKSALRVVLRALRVVGKDGVGLAYPFEPVLRIWGIAAVRVALHCQLPVRLLDLLRARFWRYAQGFVVA